MKFFSALKSAEFATRLFAKVGFDFNAAEAAGDENALKVFIASQAVASDVAQLETLNKALESATAENAAHLAKIAELNASVSSHVPLLAQFSRIQSSLASCGVKIDATALEGKTPEESEALVRTALETRVSTKARELVAATGGPLLDETPAADATSKPGLLKKEMTHAEFSALSPGAKMNFCKAGGKITDLQLNS